MMADGILRVRLTTCGRRSGRPHTVWLTAVVYNGDYYFSRHHPDSDWFLNAIHDPSVVMHIKDDSIHGTAARVEDTQLVMMISAIKYPGQRRAADKRVAIKVVVDPS